jgi:hypothetical protein
MATAQQEKDAGILFDLLVEGEQTYITIRARTGWSRTKIIKTVQVLRDILGDGDEISVTCEPQGKCEPWLYALRAGEHIIDSSESAWLPNRFGDAERRLMTIRHVLDAAVQGLDGRTAIGRKARIYRMHLRRAEEEIALLSSDGSQ